LTGFKVCWASYHFSVVKVRLQERTPSYHLLHPESMETSKPPTFHIPTSARMTDLTALRLFSSLIQAPVSDALDVFNCLCLPALSNGLDQDLRMYILYKMKGKGVKVKNVVTLRGKK